MIESQYTSKFSQHLNDSFYWFKKVIFQKITESVREVFLADFNLKLVGLSEKDNVFFSGEEYFVTRIRVNKGNEVFFRISAPLMNMFLSKALGTDGKQFSTATLTELEAKLLTAVNDHIFKGISPFLPKDREPEDFEEYNTSPLHITFLAKDSNNVMGKFIVSIPINLLPEVRPMALQQNFDLGSFPNHKVNVKIITGKSELSLYEIQHIESGDIVVLEQSNIRQMQIDAFGSHLNFLINPETSIITGIDNDGGETVADNTNNETMWDAIPVEITAEFDSVSITLGELKQISEGAIVDVGSIYENKIFLKVEGKPVASGELIIINDKYAVRVDEVYTAAPAPTVQQAAPARPQPAQRPQTPPRQAPQQANNQDFNYDNFDIEDESI